MLVRMLNFFIHYLIKPSQTHGEVVNISIKEPELKKGREFAP